MILEERISKNKAIELYDKGLLNSLEAGVFASLQTIHAYLFEEIYPFAGKIRVVNISKGSFRFAPVMYLEASLKHIEAMPQSNFDEIVEKYVEMNIAHPFLQQALTNDINNRELYMKGIDNSYYYEGYNQFKTNSL